MWVAEPESRIPSARLVWAEGSGVPARFPTCEVTKKSNSSGDLSSVAVKVTQVSGPSRGGRGAAGADRETPRRKIVME